MSREYCVGPVTRAEKAEAEVERLRDALMRIADAPRGDNVKEQWLEFREAARSALVKR
jgi:hypothetical protein